MNSFKMVAAVATVLMTTGAFAQTSATQPATSSAALPATTAAAAPGATSSATLGEAAKAPSKPWTVELYHYTKTPMTNVTYNQGVSETQNYVGFKHKVFGTRSLGIRQLFSTNYMKNSSTSPVHVGNTYIHYTEPHLYNIGDTGIEGTGVARLYLPTGETARFNSKDNGSVRLYWINAKSVGKWDFDTTVLGQAWSNTQDSYKASSGDVVQNSDFYLYPMLDAGYNITPDLALVFSLGTENTWYRAAGVARSGDLTTTVAWKAMPQVTLTANISDDVTWEGTDVKDRGFVPFRDDETTLLFEAIVTL